MEPGNTGFKAGTILIALSPDDRRSLAISGHDGKITIRSLPRIIVSTYRLLDYGGSYYLVYISFYDIRVGSAALDSWKRDQLENAAIPESQNPNHQVLAS